MASDTVSDRSAGPGPATARPGVRETMRTLAGFQKSNRGAPAYSRFVNRPVGRVFAALAYRYGLSPNGVTAVSACTTLTGLAVLVLVPVSVWTGLVVGLLLAAGYAIDSADGQVARLTGRGSIAGEWLDHSVDCVKATLVHLAVPYIDPHHLRCAMLQQARPDYAIDAIPGEVSFNAYLQTDEHVRWWDSVSGDIRKDGVIPGVTREQPQDV